MKRVIQPLRCIGLFLALALLSGCASSTVQSRKQQRYSAYQALSPDFQTLVDQGRIKIGMPPDAVFIAWGQPDQISEGENETGHTTTWAWYGSYLQDMQTWGWRRMYYSTSAVSYIRATVLFANGTVKQWQTYPAPGY